MDEDRLLGRKRHTPYKDSLTIFLIIAALILLCSVLFAVRFVGIYVKGSSMSPTLTGAEDENGPGGDYLYADTYAMPDYGDIVVVKKSNTTTLIKRVIAMGGDAVYIDHGTVFISYGNSGDFVALEEDYVLEENNDPDLPHNTYRSAEDPLIVGENQLFVLGDNRGNRYATSLDSRTYGTFSYDELIGVVPDWSVNMKGFFTAIYTFFAF